MYEYDIHPETFEIKIAGKEDDPIKNVDPKWIGYWISAVFYKLTKKLPNQWVDLPVGDICQDPALNKLQEFSVEVAYQQWDRNLCMIKSLASALSYIGLENESKIDKECDSYDGLPVNSSCFLLKTYERKCTNYWYLYPLQQKMEK